MDEGLQATGRRVQRIEIRSKGWTMARRRLFLDALAATCNVAAALRATGMKKPALYALRRRDAAFSAAWREALEIGYERLEEELLRRALEAVERLEIDPDAAGVDGLPSFADARAAQMLPADAPEAEGQGAAGKAGSPGIAAIHAANADLPGVFRLALSVLARRDAAMRKGPVPVRRRMTTDEVNVLLARKLDALAASRARARAASAAGIGEARIGEARIGAGTTGEVAGDEAGA